MPTDADALVDTVAQAIHARGLLSPGERILVALSGGPDSVCLLQVLHELGYGVVAAHFNHRTRGADSDADAALARAHADRLGVPFHEESDAVAEEACKAGRNFHDYAREARYRFLHRAARLHGCAAAATGHHADDQAETVLMRIVRGTGPRGLGGIPPLRDDGGVRIVRPLLDCTRDAILAYLRDRGLDWREDASNRQVHYFRNRVRHGLMPLLRAEYNTGIRDALTRLAESSRAEDEFLAAQAEAFLDGCLRGAAIDRAAFAKGHRALQRRALVSLARRYGPEWPFERVDAAVDFVCGAPAGKAFESGGMRLLNAAHVTEFGPVGSEEGGNGADAPLSIAVPGETLAYGRHFSVRVHERAPEQGLKAYCSPDRQLFDADAAGSGLAVRRWQPGDRFTPLGMQGSRKLQDYFTDLKLSAGERSRELILTAGGRILWVVGRAVDARGAVTTATRRVVEVEVVDADE